MEDEFKDIPSRFFKLSSDYGYVATASDADVNTIEDTIVGHRVIAVYSMYAPLLHRWHEQHPPPLEHDEPELLESPSSTDIMEDGKKSKGPSV